MQLILASSSPFRKSQLEKCRLSFSQFSPEIDETPLVLESIADMVLRLGEQKALKIAETHANALIIASDQAALCDGLILGKPGNHQKAIEQLQFMRSKKTVFYTSVILLNANTKNIQKKVVTTEVTLKALSNQQIENYLKLDQPYQCAGSFKSESLGVALFDKIESEDPNALMGLPMITLIKFLTAEGCDPLMQHLV